MNQSKVAALPAAGRAKTFSTRPAVSSPKDNAFFKDLWMGMNFEKIETSP
jgi:hypothetical protein